MKYDLIEDIRNSPEIMAKIRAEDRRYAQNLYASWCNMQWCKNTGVQLGEAQAALLLNCETKAKTTWTTTALVCVAV